MPTVAIPDTHILGRIAEDYATAKGISLTPAAQFRGLGDKSIEQRLYYILSASALIGAVVHQRGAVVDELDCIGIRDLDSLYYYGAKKSGSAYLVEALHIETHFKMVTAINNMPEKLGVISVTQTSDSQALEELAGVSDGRDGRSYVMHDDIRLPKPSTVTGIAQFDDVRKVRVAMEKILGKF